jgi:hypothetical protein
MAFNGLVLVTLATLLTSQLAAAQTPGPAKLVPTVLPWGNLSQSLSQVGADSTKA